MLRSAILMVSIAAFATIAGADTVYKWIDTSGQTHYTDRPPEDPRARVLSVFERDEVGEDGGAADDGEDTADAEPAFDAGPPPIDNAPDDTVESVQADVDRVRSEQCKEAQERYKTYVESRRLFRQLPNGEREYLSDAELTKARVEAKQEVDDLCR